MRAMVFHGPGQKSWDEVPDPIITQPTDAIVRVEAVTICGTDLHILGGDVPEFAPGRILGHEAVGSRLDAAAKLGADVIVDSGRDNPADVIARLTGGLGADVTIEAVGIAETFETAVDLVRPGGHVANIGVHGKPATLHLEKIWIRDRTITTGLVDTYSTPRLIDLVASGRLDPAAMITHRFTMDEFPSAYDTFARVGETGALKVVITAA
ncbi:zinc-binding dehydrogenase [Nocardia sp. NPDC051981]|uniref:zinc-binding dehydrogenase n=1 Tax=Nocardia sp. NPDC051981 TaxID=3155417 RepID=UPI003449E034